MKKLITKNLNGNKILILFILTNILFVLMISITIPKVLKYAGSMKMFDVMPTGYSFEYVNQFLKAIGKDGRNAYLLQQIPLDLIYPCLYTITYTLLITYFLKKLDKLNSNLYYLCFIPIFVGLFDYLENFGIINILVSYPNNSTTIIQLTSLFTISKSIFGFITFMTIVILGLKYIFVAKKR